MTLILGCLTRDFVVLASDRRLTAFDTGKVVDEDENKMVILCGVGIIGYSGISRIDGQFVERWVVDQLLKVGTDEDPLLALARAATISFNRMPYRLDIKRHAFAVAGYAKLRSLPDDPALPMATAVTNAMDNEWNWLDKAESSFRLVKPHGIRPRISNMIFWTGAALKSSESAILKRQIRRVLEQRNHNPLGGVVDTLVTGVRAVSRRNSTVGPNVLATVMPRSTLNTANVTTSHGYPDWDYDGITAAYYPESSDAGLIYAPALVAPGLGAMYGGVFTDSPEGLSPLRMK